MYSYESDYVEKLSKENLTLARKFSLNFRYIDDLFVGNFPDFREHIYKIYPRVLEIKPESNNPVEVAFLDLRLKCNNFQVSFSIYDKRDDFNFSIVNFPFIDSCIPKKSALGVFFSQLIRYARLNSTFQGFRDRTKQLKDKLLNQGYYDKELKRIALRFFRDYHDLLSKFDIVSSVIFLREIW